MDWQAAKRAIEQFGSFEEREYLEGRSLQAGAWAVSDFTIYYGVEKPIRTADRVAQVGTNDERYVMKGSIRVGGAVSDAIKILGEPDAKRSGAMQWQRLGLEIEPTPEGQGKFIGWIGVFRPKESDHFFKSTFRAMISMRKILISLSIFCR
jgi:hypothetical protein